MGEKGCQDDLDDRKAAILRSVVAEYIQTAQPVGSTHVIQSSGLRVSPATVRNEMSILEDEGYLAQPHTSAGRIPTDKGYRFFVDHLPVESELAARKSEEVRGFFQRTHGELEQMLHDTSKMLSTLTHYASVVVVPNHDSAIFRSVQLVLMGRRSVLVLFVLSDGTVEKHSIELQIDYSEEQIELANRHISLQLLDRARKDPGKARATGDLEVDELLSLALSCTKGDSHTSSADRIYVGGASNMAAAFDAIETVRSVLNILEQQIMVVNLIRGVLESDQLTVAIGAEHGVIPLAQCAIVVAPYRFGSDEMGVVGVLGPTRMDYENAMSTVAVVGQQLESRLNES